MLKFWRMFTGLGGGGHHVWKEQEETRPSLLDSGTHALEICGFFPSVVLQDRGEKEGDGFTERPRRLSVFSGHRGASCVFQVLAGFSSQPRTPGSRDVRSWFLFIATLPLSLKLLAAPAAFFVLPFRQLKTTSCYPPGIKYNFYLVSFVSVMVAGL